MRTDAVRIALILTLALPWVLHLTLSGSLAYLGLYCARPGCLGIFLGSPGVSWALPRLPWVLEALAGSPALSPGSLGPSLALLGSPRLSLRDLLGDPGLFGGEGATEAPNNFALKV
jgi:hypothetical protein